MTVLLVLLTLAVFLAADFMVQRARKAAAQRAFQQAADRTVPAGVPARIRLLANHTWVRPEADGTILLGIDDFLARVLGAVERIVLPEPGSVVGPARLQIALSAGGRTLPLASPMTGRTLAVNTELLTRPALAAQDPYNRGWFLRIAPAEKTGNIHEVEKPGVWLKDQWTEFKEFIAARRLDAAPALLQDGGLPVSGLLQEFDEEVWQAFAASFASLPPEREGTSC